MSTPKDVDIFEEDGVWLVRVLAPSDELSVQEYRCASERVAQGFAALFSAMTPRNPLRAVTRAEAPPAHVH